jgi:KaiC/GvpD/RAD55 family RecA-like ATPase
MKIRLSQLKRFIREESEKVSGSLGSGAALDPASVKELFRMLEKYRSLNFVIGETEQNPQVYSRSGVEEFLGDGVLVFYNLKIAGVRKNALEILKLRSGKHVKEMIPYALTEKGIEIYYKQKLE